MPTAQEKAEAKLVKLQETAKELGVEFTPETTPEELATKVKEAKDAAKEAEKAAKAAAHEIEEVIETRNGFTFFRRGEEYSVKDRNEVVIAPMGERAVAEQLFRNISRKF